VTAQNTQGVSAIHSIPTDIVEAQLESVFSDMPIEAVKIGMLSDANTITMIARVLKKYQPNNIVLDPVMVATSGDVLLQSEAVNALVSDLIPLANLITPNLYEAQVLLNKEVTILAKTSAELEVSCKQVLQMGAKGVLLKGGHMNTPESTDVWATPDTCLHFSSDRISTKNTHGTGCTLSSAIASYLAQGFDMVEAIKKAKDYITQALYFAQNYQLGQGNGPVEHFYRLKQAKCCL